MRTLDRLSELASKVISKFSLKQFVDINEQPLFRMPNYMFRMRYWLGALVASAFIYEVVTGLFLLLNYYPSNPYNQTQYLISKIPFGAPILYSHLYGAYFMIFLAYIHLFRNYFDGAYKKPRQLLWVIGILLFAITLGTAFTGYSLPADILGSDADGVAQGIVAGAPGGALINTILFGNGLSLDMYTRLLGWHIILTAVLGALVGLHFMLFEQYGVMPSKKVMEKAPAVYPKEEWEKFNPWFPRNFVYTLELTLFIWGLILIVPNVIINIPNIPNGISPLISPAPLVSPSGTLPPGTPAFPPWFFLFLYKAIDFMEPNGSAYTPFIASLLAGLLPALYLLILPWIDRSDETSAHRRSFFAGVGILLITYLLQMSVWGALQPGVPVFFPTQVGIMLPPIVIAFASLYLIPRAVHSKKGERTLTPKNAAILIAVGLVVIGTLHDLVNDPIIYLIGVFVPILLGLVFFALSFAKKVFTGIAVLLITYLLQLLVWGSTKPGFNEPLSVQIDVMIPPLFIAFIALYLLPKLLQNVRGRRKLTPLNVSLLVIVALAIAGTWNGLLQNLSVYMLGIFIPIALTVILMVTGLVGRTSTDEEDTNEPRLLTYNVAIVMMVVLFLVAAGILALLVRLPSTGPESTYWGVGAGIILLIFSYALSLYGYLYYPQENDEVRILPKAEGRIFRRRMEVSGSSGEDSPQEAKSTGAFALETNNEE